MQNQYQNQNKFGQAFRWLIIAQFFWAQFLDNFKIAMLVPIWPLLAYYYQIEQNQVNWLVYWIYIFPFVLGFFFNVVIQKSYGLSLILCCFFESAGMWLAWYAKHNYISAVSGYAIMALGSAFIGQTPLYLSKLWFEPSERIFSTFLGQYAIQIGGLVGYLYTSLYFQGIEDWDQLVKQIEQVFFVASILLSFSFVVSFIAFVRPNRENYEFLAREGQWKSIQKIFSQTEFTLDIICFSIFIQFPWIYPSLLMYQQIILNKNSLEIFSNSLSFQISGIIMASYFTYKLSLQSRKGFQQNYDLYLKRFITIGYLAFIIEILFLENISNILMIVLNIIIGGGIASVQSVVLESLMEKHYPISELALGQLLVGSACIISFLLGFILTSNALYSYGLQLFAYFLIFPFCFILVFYKTKFVRFESEA